MQTISGLQSRLNNSCKCRFRSKINLLLPRWKRDAEMLWLYREVTCNNKSFFSSDMWGHRHIVKQQERWRSVGEGFYFFSSTRPKEMPSNTLFSDLLYCCRYPIKSSALAHAFIFRLHGRHCCMAQQSFHHHQHANGLKQFFQLKGVEPRLFLLWILFICYAMVCLCTKCAYSKI